MTVASLEELAASQYGVFTRAQGSENVTARTLQYHGQPDGRWRRVAPGVYVVRDAPLDWRQPLVAAQLWAGPGGVLWRRSAGGLWGLDGVDWGPVDLSLDRSTPARRGWNVRRRAVDPGRTRLLLDGLVRVTDPLLTLADLARSTADRAFEWTVESALRLRLVTPAELEALAAERGMARLRRILNVRGGPGVAPTGSVLETMFVQAAREVDVPPLERQVHLDLGAGFGNVYLDLAWPDLGLFIEIDGKWHDEPKTTAYDRNRQNEIVIALGWRPLRYGSADIRRHPHYCAKRLAEAYARATEGWVRRAAG